MIWTEQQIMPLFDVAGNVEGVEGIMRNMTERAQTYQMLEQRVEERTRAIERRQRVAEGLHAILTILNSNCPPDEILKYILTQACQLLETSIGAIYCLNPTATLLTIRASRGMDADDAALNLPADWGPIGQAVQTRQPVVVVDTIHTLLHQNDQQRAPQVRSGLTRLAQHYRALLAVPIIVKQEVYGVIALYSRAPRKFSDEEARLAMTLSDQAALAIENARLVAAAQGKAVLEERQRLARDLHDSVTQALYGITLYAEAATRLLAAGDVTTVGDHLRALQETAQEALQEMRLLIFELRPPVLEHEGLVAALQARLEGVEGRTNVETRFVVEGAGKLPASVEQALYRITQEALNNALKHAHAHRITVSLRQEWPKAVLEIVDDGVGFDPANVCGQGGLGLRGMVERVAQLGGQLILQSAPGAGTQIRVEMGR